MVMPQGYAFNIYDGYTWKGVTWTWRVLKMHKRWIPLAGRAPSPGWVPPIRWALLTWNSSSDWSEVFLEQQYYFLRDCYEAFSSAITSLFKRLVWSIPSVIPPQLPRKWLTWFHSAITSLFKGLIWDLSSA